MDFQVFTVVFGQQISIIFIHGTYILQQAVYVASTSAQVSLSLCDLLSICKYFKPFHYNEEALESAAGSALLPPTPSSASTAAVSIRAEPHTALPIPTSSRRCSASDLPALPAKNQYTEPKFPNFQICCWPLCYDFNGFGVRTLKSSPFFTFHPPNLPFTFPSLTFTCTDSPEEQFSSIPVVHFCTEPLP